MKNLFFFLINSNSETIKNKAKEEKGGFFGILSGTLGASLLGDLLANKAAGEGMTRAGQNL